VSRKHAAPESIAAAWILGLVTLVFLVDYVGVEVDQIAACEDYATRTAIRPGTVDFSWLDSHFVKTGNATMTIESTFTAMNGSGQEVSYGIRCFFKYGQFATATIHELK
jgi:hypothetical protein